MMRSFIVMRLVAATNAASGLSMAVGYPSAAQDDEENGRTAAQDVRELVLNERLRFLAHVASINLRSAVDTHGLDRRFAEPAVAFAVLAAVTAAGFGLRQRFIYGAVRPVIRAAAAAALPGRLAD
jgi:hypothetical protein